MRAASRTDPKQRQTATDELGVSSPLRLTRPPNIRIVSQPFRGTDVRDRLKNTKPLILKFDWWPPFILLVVCHPYTIKAQYYKKHTEMPTGR